VLFAVACVARLICDSWLAPGAFAPAVWSGFVVVALSVAPEYPVSALAPWLIVALTLAVMMGAQLGEGVQNGGIISRQIQPFRRVRLLPLVILFSLLASAGAVYLAIGAFSEHGLSFSIAGLLAIGHFLSVTRYSGEQEPLVYRVLITWSYPAAMLGGVDFALSNGRGRKLLSLAAFAPGLLVGFFQSERAPMLIAFCLWLGTFLATKIFKTGGAFHYLSRRLVLGMACFVLAALCFYIFLDSIRTHDTQNDFIVEADWARVKSSFLGSLSVFSQWACKLDAAPLSYGAYTFAGVFDLLGVHPRQQGVFENPVTLPDGSETNVYSAFRGLVQDFSFIGALVLCVGVGGLAGASYRHASAGRFEWIPVLAAFYAFVCFSPIVSIFTYNGPILALVVCAFVCKIMSKPPALKMAGKQSAGRVLLNAPGPRA
jgi:oligosaccharide repeat unit polymerase